MEIKAERLAYLKLLSNTYPSIRATSTAIIKLNAELNLPKGTEHFISDIHGEFEAFQHVLKNGSGSIRRKIEETFPDLPPPEKRALATLIYYPEEKLPLILQTAADEAAWYRSTLQRLLKLCRVTASKYTRRHVRQFLPGSFTDLIDELLHPQVDIENKRDYYQSIIDTVIATGSAGDFIIALAELIQRLAIARLHVLGDIYDRGPGAHLIMDTLLDYHSVDIQWGNHDIMRLSDRCQLGLGNLGRDNAALGCFVLLARLVKGPEMGRAFIQLTGACGRGGHIGRVVAGSIGCRWGKGMMRIGKGTPLDFLIEVAFAEKAQNQLKDL